MKRSNATCRNHCTDEAIFEKLELSYWYDSRRREEIAKIRREARLKHETRADGRVANFDYLGVKRWYDEVTGLDEDGFYPDGESAIPGACNRDGWAFDRPRYIKARNRRLYDRDGYDLDGFDRDGINRDGYNTEGVDRRGFRRNHIHVKTGTYEDPDGYNFYDLKDGRNRAGELDSDVALALAYLGGPTMKLKQFAEQNGLELTEVQTRLEQAKRKMPSLTERLAERSTAVSGQAFAILRAEMRRVIDGALTVEAFWTNHPSMDCKVISRMGGNDFLCYLAQQICLCDPKDYASINQLSRLLDTFYASEMLDSLEVIRRALPVPAQNTSGPTARQMYVWRDFVKKFVSRNLESLNGLKVSVDGGVTYISITLAEIDCAVEQIRQRREVISTLTVKEEIIKQYRSA